MRIVGIVLIALGVISAATGLMVLVLDRKINHFISVDLCRE